jgi:hypothetical protein
LSIRPDEIFGETVTDTVAGEKGKIVVAKEFGYLNRNIRHKGVQQRASQPFFVAFALE